MKIKKLVLILSLFIVLFIFNGCDAVNGLLGITEPADLVVKSVEPLKDGDDLSGIRIVFANKGGEDVADVKYAVVLSTDETVSVTSGDTVIYEDKVDIPAGGEKQIDLDGEGDIGPWIESHTVSLADGTYFIGASIDTDDSVAEASETNNEGSSNISFYMTGGDSTEPSVTVNFSGASNFNNYDLVFAVFNKGDYSSPSNVLAVGLDTIVNGVAEVTAYEVIDYNTLETNSTPWMGTENQEYDIFMFLDKNGNLQPDDPLDYAYPSPHTIKLNADGFQLDVSESDFTMVPLPATFGLYSENPAHTVYFEPDFWAQDCTADRTNTEKTAYDGSYVIKVTFTGSGGSDNSAWMHFTYPPMDISSSSNFVFALEHTSGTDFGIILVSNSNMYGNNNGVGTYTPTHDGIWNIYRIPITEFGSGFDPTQMTGFKIGQGSGTGATYYFDDIHFE